MGRRQRKKMKRKWRRVLFQSYSDLSEKKGFQAYELRTNVI